MLGSRRVHVKVAHRSCNPARFSKRFSGPPNTAGSSQWAWGAIQPQPIRRQQAARVTASNALIPAPRGPLGGPPWTVGGVMCVRWDWLAPQREGRGLASEDGPIPRACGLARAGQGSLPSLWACYQGQCATGPLIVKGLCKAAGRNNK